jgi:DNA-nicking Smr family endonuclease
MSRAGRKPPGGGRAVTDEEADLWRYATRALDPVKVKARVTVIRDPAADVPGDVSSRTTAHAPASRKPPQPKPSPQVPVSSKAAAPPLAEFDRRKVRQIASGKVEVAARIDLHGLRQRDARAELHAFLLRAYTSGHRTVLVITGKGDGETPVDGLGTLLGERQRGVLRRSVPHWLEEPDLRSIVLSYTQAGARHGGAGALYVQLRRTARGDRGERD